MTVERDAARRGLDQLQYEVLHNLVLETTRMGIEVKNLKMRVESLTGRLEFNERRARALESVVVYKSPDERERGGGGGRAPLAEPAAAAIGTTAAAIGGGGAARAPPAETRRTRSAQPPSTPPAWPARRRAGVDDHGRTAGAGDVRAGGRRRAAKRSAGHDTAAESIEQARWPPTRAPDRKTDDPDPGEE